MRPSNSFSASHLEGLPSQASPDRSTPEAIRVLDWTNLDSAPSSLDVSRVAGSGGRLAVLVNTPRMLRAADVFAEQAGLHGTYVRVFIDAKEAMAWLYKDVPTGVLASSTRS